MRFIPQLIVALILLASSRPSLAQNACRDLFRVDTLESKANRDFSARREAVVEFLKQHRNVPSFIKETEKGPVPVLLLNKDTYATLAPLIENSIGYGYDITPNWVENGVVKGIGTEHAILRSQGTLIDIGHAGTRRGPLLTEIHNNGIAWKELAGLLPWRRVMIQNSYLMPKKDLQTMRFYHLARRASIFRARYAFTEEHNVDRKTPNLCESASENCFRFSKSDQAPLMIKDLNQQLESLLGSNTNAFQQNQDVQKFIGRARKQILDIDPYDPANLNWYSAQKILKQTGLDKKMPSNLNDAQKLIVANLLVAKSAVTEYLALLKRYKISDHHGHQDIDAGVVSFTLIYDNMNVAEAFNAGRYEAHGTFFNWTNESQHPLP